MIHPMAPAFVDLAKIVGLTKSSTWPERMCVRDLLRGDNAVSEETLTAANPTPSLVNVTHLVYALHALSLLIGITTAATIIGAFVFGMPSIIAVIINYLKRAEARGTFLESHFRWQIRTFWFGLLWCLLGGFLFVTFIGIPLAIVVFIAAGLWVIYRIGRGWLALRDRRAMYNNL